MEELGLALGDLIVFGAVLVSGIHAYSRGFVREALAVLCWVAAAWTSAQLLDWSGELLAPYVPDPVVASFLGGGAVFFVVVVTTSLVAGRLATGFSNGFFAPLDRSLGFLFGAIRGLAVVAVLYALLSATIWAQDCPSWARDARTLRLVHFGAQVFWALVPGETPPAAAGCAVAMDGYSAPTAGGTSTARDPAPEAPPEEDGPGYAPAERESMDRLINLEGEGPDAPPEPEAPFERIR